MQEWYYQDGSSYEGPVTLEGLRALRAAGRIGDRTLVWSTSRGGEWTSLRDAGLVPISAHPPALPTTPVNDVYAWTLASLPILGLFIEWVIATAFPMRIIPHVWVVLSYAVAYPGLAMLDLEEIRKAERDDRRFWTLASILVPPIYLFVRSRLTAERPTHLFVWIMSVLVAAAIGAGLNL